MDRLRGMAAISSISQMDSESELRWVVAELAKRTCSSVYGVGLSFRQAAFEFLLVCSSPQENNECALQVGELVNGKSLSEIAEIMVNCKVLRGALSDAPPEIFSWGVKALWKTLELAAYSPKALRKAKRTYKYGKEMGTSSALLLYAHALQCPVACFLLNSKPVGLSTANTCAFAHNAPFRDRTPVRLWQLPQHCLLDESLDESSSDAYRLVCALDFLPQGAPIVAFDDRHYQPMARIQIHNDNNESHDAASNISFIKAHESVHKGMRALRRALQFGQIVGGATVKTREEPSDFLMVRTRTRTHTHTHTHTHLVFHTCHSCPHAPARARTRCPHAPVQSCIR